jgi:hypothetical protein
MYRAGVAEDLAVLCRDVRGADAGDYLPQISLWLPHRLGL